PCCAVFPARRSSDLVLVGGVHVGRVGGEFGRAGIHALVDRADAHLVAQLADFGFGGIQQIGQAAVGEATALELTQGVEIEIGQRLLFEDRKSTRLNSSHVKISYAVF